MDVATSSGASVVMTPRSHRPSFSYGRTNPISFSFSRKQGGEDITNSFSDFSASLQHMRAAAISTSASGKESIQGSYRLASRGISISLNQGHLLIDPDATKFDQLLPFLPQIVLDHLENPSHRSISPESTQVFGSILFLDIKGYSKLADILSDDAQHGAEALSQILNSFFSKLVDVVLKAGGDIIKFAGDAVICYFRAESEVTLADAIYTSVLCALDAREQLNNFPINEDQSVFLTLHASIGAGLLNTFHVGGIEDKWEFFMTGSPFEHIESTGKLAHNAGDIYMCRENFELVMSRVTAQDIPRTKIMRLLDVHKRENLSPLKCGIARNDTVFEKSIRSYIVKPVLMAVDSGKTQWISEIRTVSVLFCSLLGVSLAESSLDFWQSCFYSMQQGIRDFGGIVRQWLVDDKGATLVAAFGLPGAVHDDDVTRAVRSAMSIKSRLTHLNVKSSLGVTTGKVYVGLVGNQNRCEYAMVGDVVNMAARLMVAADGDILCDAATQQSANIHFEEIGLLSLKGKRQKVPAFRPVGLKEKKIENNLLIGREREMALLTSAIEAIEAEEGSVDVILIEGVPGIGKSSIIQEAVSISESLGVEVLVSEGDPFQTDKIYHCWSKIFEQIFDLEGVHDISSRKNHVDEFFDSCMPDRKKFIPLLNVVIPLEYPENDFTATMAAQCRASNTEDFLISILSEYIYDQRILIVFEDVHNIDRSSWDLILSLYRINYRFGVIMTTRNLSGDMFKMLLSQPSTQLMKIEGLPQGAMVALLTSYLGTSNISKSVASYIISKAQGNPFFAEQLTDYLIDSNIITKSNGRIAVSDHVEDIHQVPVPDSVERIVLTRLDSLSESQRHVLKVGSVFGRSFIQASLQHLMQSEAIFDDLNALVDFGLLVFQSSTTPSPTSPSKSMRFSRKYSRVSNAIDSMEQTDKNTTPRSSSGKELLFTDTMLNPTKSRCSSHSSNIRPMSHRLSYTTYLIQRSQSAPTGPIYRFRNSITRDVIYNSMTMAQRQLLHQSVAEWHEATYDTDLNFLVSILAHHWTLAGRPDKAVDYLERAGQQALDCFSNYEAVAFFLKALELADSVDQAELSFLQLSHWNISISEAYIGLGKIGAAAEHLRTALQILGEPLPSTKFQIRRKTLSQMFRQFQHRLHLSCPSRPSVVTESIQALLKKAHELNTSIYYYNHSRPLCVYSALRALNLSENQNEDVMSLARCYANMSLVTSYTPYTRSLASYYGRKALLLIEDIPKMDRSWALSQAIGVLMVMGSYNAGMGRMIIARETFLHAVEQSKFIGDRRQWEEALSQMALVELYMGQFEACLICAERCVISSSQRGDQQLHQRASSTAASCCLALNRIDSAMQYIGITPEKKPLFKAYSTLAVAYLRRGSMEEAFDAAFKSFEKFTEAKRTKWHVLKSYTQTIDVLIAGCIYYGSSHEKYGEFLEKVVRSCNELQHFSKHYPFAVCRAKYYEGLLRLLLHEVSAARSCFRRSLSLSVQHGFRYEQALSSLCLADRAFFATRRFTSTSLSQLHERQKRDTMSVGVSMPSNDNQQPIPSTEEFPTFSQRPARLAIDALTIFAELNATHDMNRTHVFLARLIDGLASVLDPDIGL